MKIFWIVLLSIIIIGCNVNSNNEAETLLTSENSIITGPDYGSSPVEGVGLYFNNFSSVPGTEEMLANAQNYEILKAFPFSLKNIGSYSIDCVVINFDIENGDGISSCAPTAIGWNPPDYFVPQTVYDGILFKHSLSEVTKLIIKNVTIYPIGLEEITLSPIEHLEFTFDQ